MGIRFQCPNGHSLNVKAFLAGRRGICPECSARFIIPQANGGRVEADDEPYITTPSAMAEITPDPIERTPLVEEPLLASVELAAVQERPVRRRHRNRSLTVALSAVVVLLALMMIIVLWNQT